MFNFLTEPKAPMERTDPQCIAHPSPFKVNGDQSTDGGSGHCDATRALTILESGKADHPASQQAGRSGKYPAKRFDWLTDASAKTTPPSVSHAFPRPLTYAPCPLPPSVVRCPLTLNGDGRAMHCGSVRSVGAFGSVKKLKNFQLFRQRRFRHPIRSRMQI